MSFSGEITERSLSRLQKSITKKASKIRPGADRTVLVDLRSGGGNLFETFKFVANIPALSKSLNVVINTRVKSSCESSCTVLFTAGTERIARKKASFGFHSPKVESRLPRNLTQKEVLEIARTRWLDAVGAVDAQLAADLQRNNDLMRDHMSYYKASRLLHGYVTRIEE